MFLEAPELPASQEKENLHMNVHALIRLLDKRHTSTQTKHNLFFHNNLAFQCMKLHGVFCECFQKTAHKLQSSYATFAFTENNKILLRLWSTQAMHLQYKDRSLVKERLWASWKHSVKTLQDAATTNASGRTLSRLRFEVSEVASPHNYFNIKKADHVVLNFITAFTAVKWKL